jgi:hypothetical protein
MATPSDSPLPSPTDDTRACVDSLWGAACVRCRVGPGRQISLPRFPRVSNKPAELLADFRTPYPQREIRGLG